MASVQRDMTPQDTMLVTCFLTVLLGSIVYCWVWEYLHIAAAFHDVNAWGKEEQQHQISLTLQMPSVLGCHVLSGGAMPEAHRCETTLKCIRQGHTKICCLLLQAVHLACIVETCFITCLADPCTYPAAYAYNGIIETFSR